MISTTRERVNSTTEKIHSGRAQNLNEQSQRMQEMIERIDQIADDASRDLMQSCIREVISFYGAGLKQIMAILRRRQDMASTKILNELIKDNFVSGLLLIHELHPLDLETRLKLALEKVRPYMESHGGDVKLVSLENGTARLQLSGSCKGCASSSITMELALKQSIEEGCPDLVGLEVDGVTPPKSGPPSNGSSNGIAGTPAWHSLAGAGAMNNGDSKVFNINGTQVLICRINGRPYAYQNQCPACGMPFISGSLRGNEISCRPGHRFNLENAFQANDKDMRLDPFPILQDGEDVKVSL